MRSLLQTFTVVSSPPFPMSSLSIVLTINSVLTVLHPLSWVAHHFRMQMATAALIAAAFHCTSRAHNTSVGTPSSDEDSS